VADGDAIVLRLLSQALTIFGYEPVTASNGLVALELVNELLPTVAVIDAHMPDVDGVDIVTAIRSNARTADMRVMLIAASTDDADRLTAAGADLVLRKPFKLAELEQHLRSLLEE
jgi:DNA-binding response OmpR family regulator